MDVSRENVSSSLRAAFMLFTPMQGDQCCLKTLMAPKERRVFGLVIWRQLLGNGFQWRTWSQLLLREEDAVSKTSSHDISDEALGLGLAAIITAARGFWRTLDDRHLCSHCFLYRSFLSLHGNTDEYPYYFPLNGIERLPSCWRGETVVLN